MDTKESTAQVPQVTTMPQTPMQATKFCKHCGGIIPEKAVICTLCGCQVEEIDRGVGTQPNIVINNANTNSNINTNQMYAGMMKKPKNKWAAFFLCLFLGYLGAHKFYEGRIGAGILYLLTLGLLGIGWAIDCIILLFKPNPYFV